MGAGLLQVAFTASVSAKGVERKTAVTLETIQTELLDVKTLLRHLMLSSHQIVTEHPHIVCVPGVCGGWLWAYTGGQPPPIQGPHGADGREGPPLNLSVRRKPRLGGAVNGGEVRR